MTCSSWCKEEFKLRNLGLKHSSPDLFVRSQWTWYRGANVTYILYRLAAALCFLTISIMAHWEYYDLYGRRHGSFFWAIYYTHWSLLLLTIDVVLRFILACYGYYLYRNSGGCWGGLLTSMPWYLRMEWVLRNAATGAGFVITIAYWAVFYQGQPISASNFNKHAINTVYLVLDVFVSAMPVRLFHVIHVWIYGLVYVLYTMAYQELECNHVPIYAFMDWHRRPKMALTVVLVLAFAVFLGLWLVYYGLCQARLAMSGRLSGRNPVAVTPQVSVIPPDEEAADNGPSETVDPDKLCVPSGSKEVGQTNGPKPADESSEASKPNEVSELTQSNETQKPSDSGGSKKSTESNESNKPEKADEPGEAVEFSEPNKQSELNETMKPSESDEPRKQDDPSESALLTRTPSVCSPLMAFTETWITDSRKVGRTNTDRRRNLSF